MDHKSIAVLRRGGSDQPDSTVHRFAQQYQAAGHANQCPFGLLECQHGTGFTCLPQQGHKQRFTLALEKRAGYHRAHVHRKNLTFAPSQ